MGDDLKQNGRKLGFLFRGFIFVIAFLLPLPLPTMSCVGTWTPERAPRKIIHRIVEIWKIWGFHLPFSTPPRGGTWFGGRGKRNVYGRVGGRGGEKQNSLFQNKNKKVLGAKTLSSNSLPE
jgi:hypothetical protein